MYELEDGNLKLISRSNSPKSFPLTTIYQKKIDEDHTLLINTFRNKVLLVENESIKDNMFECDSSFENWFKTPFSDPKYFTLDTVYAGSSQKQENRIQISLAITYACNLHCSYCFQQQYGGLVRKPITLEKLEVILGNISKLQDENPGLDISIGLFGGEPLLPKNEAIIDRVFDYCVDHKIKVDITTNGIFLPYFAKKLIIHRSIISAIAITVNTLPDTYKKIVRVTKVANNTEKLLAVTELLLNYGVVMDVGTNFDKTNLSDLVRMFEYFDAKGYFEKDNFCWNIGRVDNRFFDTDYDENIVSETDILLELIKIRDRVPDNLYAGFIQTCKNITDKLNLSFNERQLKGTYNYCWNVSPNEKVYYVDNELNLFRCTVTVGRPQYILGNLKKFDLLNYQHETKTFLDYRKCQLCHLGGFCSGGCKLSADVDFDRQCRWEKAEFEKFVDLILVPEIKAKLEELL